MRARHIGRRHYRATEWGRIQGEGREDLCTTEVGSPEMEVGRISREMKHWLRRAFPGSQTNALWVFECCKKFTHTHIEFTSNGSKYFPGQFYKFDVRVSVFLEKFEHPKYVGL